MMNVLERYRYDPQFRQLVDLMVFQIKENNFTPTEVREAAMLAQLKFEEMTLRPILLNDINSIRNKL